MKAIYKTVLLKMSGEALSGENGFGIDNEKLGMVADEIKQLHDLGVRVAIVVGGGNFWRGRTGYGMDRATADYMGMLATTINALALQDSIEQRGLSVRVQSPIEMREICEPYIRRKAVTHLDKGYVVIFAAGTGSPFFSTDTAASLRAAEINADIILSAKNIDGVYDSDPKINKDAKKFDELSFIDIIDKDLKVMDVTAASMCMDNNIPILVFALMPPENIIRAVCGEKIGTIIK
ncbi:MAG: UMP kinase [Eubacteriaceae bacterium]|nr:UMP kinase [Eubacteriaceae bacterium]MBQ1466306.1 UMP kinase [Eubacteriaceae bacterium]